MGLGSDSKLGVLEIWIRETETVRLGTKMGIFIPGNRFELK